MLKTDTRNRTKLTVLVAGLACCAATIRADGPGHSFTTLTSPYTQELFGVTASPVVVNGIDTFLGGVAFAPDGDAWVAECNGTGTGTNLHRFDRQNTVNDGHGGLVRSESVIDLGATFGAAPDGCGLVNHPAPYLGVNVVYANAPSGLWPLDAESGQPIFFGPANSNGGNGRGISVDPATSHVVYVGRDCDPNVLAQLGYYDQGVCTLWDANPGMSLETKVFARINRSPLESFDSLYFVPDGSYALASYRDAAAGTQGIAVFSRPAGGLREFYDAADDLQVVQRIAMTSMPAGIAFHSAPAFVVTLNDDGSMTKLDFGGDFSAPPVQSAFASGGFRGGLLQVGADGCLYAPQGRMPGGTSGVRYGDDAVGPDDSVVRICSGFAAGPGVAGAQWSPEPGSISGATFSDWNGNGIKDAAEPGLTGVSISLTGSATGSAVTSGSGDYMLSGVPQGLYSVSAPVSVGALSGNPTPLAVNLGPGEQRTGVDFPYTESTPPVCTSTVESGSPTRVRFTLRDIGGGTRRVIVRTLSNFQVSVNGGAAATSPVTVDLPSPSTADVAVTATQSTATLAANVQLDVVDAFGTQTSCASSVPGSTTEPPPPPTPPGGNDETIRKELTGWGRHHVVVADKLPKTMRYVSIRNGRNGVNRVEVVVNHRHRQHLEIRDGQTKSVDVARWLVAGKKNQIVLIGWGRKHDSAVVTISAKP